MHIEYSHPSWFLHPKCIFEWVINGLLVCSYCAAKRTSSEEQRKNSQKKTQILVINTIIYKYI